MLLSHPRVAVVPSQMVDSVLLENQLALVERVGSVPLGGEDVLVLVIAVGGVLLGVLVVGIVRNNLLLLLHALGNRELDVVVAGLEHPLQNGSWLCDGDGNLKFFTGIHCNGGRLQLY